jgi:hypothetical protein
VIDTRQRGELTWPWVIVFFLPGALVWAIYELRREK